MMYQPAKSKRPGKTEISSSASLLAPIKGWNARDPEGSMPPGFALYLDNWFPTPGNVQLRKGAADWVSGNGAVPTKSLMVWNARSGTPKRRLFAATDSGIYDVTVTGVAWPAVSMALTDGRVNYVNYGTTGGSYLFCVNGIDTMKQYDGAAWSSIAPLAISGGGTLTTSDIGNINVFKRSLYFLRRETMEFYYLPIDSITGTVSRFPLGALFSKGGSLLAMGTWTVDGGQGADDLAVFVTTEGQLAVYQGTDPSSASTWALVGVYDLGTPLGKKCFIKYGGDLVYISRDGAFPLTKALQSVNTQTTVAVTDLISSAFSAAATSWGQNYGWQGITSFTDQILIFNVPTTEYSLSQQYAMNTKTGAWCRLLDWNAFCWEIMDNQLYMGMTGKVALAWYGLTDFGGVINCYAKGSFQYFGGNRARSKKINLVRPVLKIGGTVAVSVAVDVDYANGLAFGPAVFNPAVGSLWGSALWGSGVWSDAAATKLDWVTVSVYEGYCAAVRLRVSSQNATVQWSATDLAFEVGNIKG